MLEIYDHIPSPLFNDKITYASSPNCAMLWDHRHVRMPEACKPQAGSTG